MKNALEVCIAGQRYVLKSDGDGERLRIIAEIVTAKVEEVRRAGKSLPTDRVAILAAVNLAEELLREREEVAALKEAVRQRTERLVACLRSLAPLAAAIPGALAEGGQPPDAQRAELERAVGDAVGEAVGDKRPDTHEDEPDAAPEAPEPPAARPLLASPPHAAPREASAPSPELPT